MGFLKKLFGFGKKEEEKVDDKVIDESAQVRNFKYLDDLIHSGVKEIVLDSDIFLDDSEESDYQDGIKLDVDDLVIDAKGHVINAERKTRIFEVTGKNIIIKNIILKNGFAQEKGGAIYNSGELVVSDSALEGNKAKDYGGVIYNSEGVLTVSGSTLEENAAEYGGAVCNSGELVVSDSALEGNKAKDYGGAILNSEGVLTVSGSSLEGNSASNGGAICNADGTLTVSDSALEGNKAKDYGGAIYIWSGTVTVSDSTLEGNTAEKSGGVIYNRDGGELTVSGSTLKGNVAEESGGALYNRASGLAVSDSTLEENIAECGGAIYNKGGNFKVFVCDFLNNKSSSNIIENKDSLQFFNSNFMSNHAPNIIVNIGGLTNISISNGKFKDNDINESIIFNDGKSCTVERTIIEKHPFNTIINKSNLTLISPKIKDERKTILNERHILIRNSSDGLEGKIYGEGTVENLDKVKFKEFDFGYLDKKIHESKNKEIILEEDISFENYEIDYFEGGIELDIDNLIINGNGHTIDAQDRTRIFYCTGKNLTIKNLTLKNGHSHKNYDNPFNKKGGAIKITHNANLTIENCKFINNTSEGASGAIHNDGGELSVFGSTLAGNTARGSGGAINNGGGGVLTVSDSTLEGNTARNGGAILNSEGVLTVSDSILSGNTAVSYGGAIYNSKGMVTVSGSTLSGNTAVSDGGAIYNSKGMVTVSGSTLSGNTAKGEYGDGGAIYNWGTLTVSGSTLAGNTARRRGGAIDNWRMYESNNCTFKDNKPDDVYEEKK